MQTWLYSIVSVLFISIIAVIGIFALAIKRNRLKRVLIYFISFAAGALFGDVFLHLLPELIEEQGFTLAISLYILSGIILSFVIEKVIHWRHCHMPVSEQHVHRFALMNIFGDLIHNFIDGLIIGASYMISIPVGIATTVAIVLHEIPQEIGDFGVLLHGGFTVKRALIYNFLTALSAVLGTILALSFSSAVSELNSFLIAFAAGSFIYIAGSDLIPELHKEEELKKNLVQTIAFAAGVLVMLALLAIG